jgi:hypothetical protein
VSLVARHLDPAVLRPQPSRRGQPDDWPTPPCLRAALLKHVMPVFPIITPIWEAAAGTGELANDLSDAGYTVIETDGFDLAQPVDFLQATPPPLQVPPVLCTNPPFNTLNAWLKHALELLDAGGLSGVVLLLRGDHLGAKSRGPYLNRAARIFVCPWRPRWISGTTTSPRFWFLWAVWMPGHAGGPIVTWLPSPDAVSGRSPPTPTEGGQRTIVRRAGSVSP